MIFVIAIILLIKCLNWTSRVRQSNSGERGWSLRIDVVSLRATDVEDGRVAIEGGSPLARNFSVESMVPPPPRYVHPPRYRERDLEKGYQAGESERDLMVAWFVAACLSYMFPGLTCKKEPSRRSEAPDCFFTADFRVERCGTVIQIIFHRRSHESLRQMFACDCADPG